MRCESKEQRKVDLKFVRGTTRLRAAKVVRLRTPPFVQNKAACSAMHSSESFFTLPTIGETG